MNTHRQILLLREVYETAFGASLTTCVLGEASRTVSKFEVGTVVGYGGEYLDTVSLIGRLNEALFAFVTDSDVS